MNFAMKSVKNIKKLFIFHLFFLFFLCVPSFAGEADVTAVDIQKESENTYHFSVTVLHDDTGWEHYADKWEITDEKGTVLGTRILQHPHVGEQPFTRSLSGVEISAQIKTVVIRAHDSVHKYGGKVITIGLPD
jgi:hypothetical protein